MENNLSILLTVLIAIAILLTAIAIVTLHKIRRIHIATYQLVADLSSTRRETEVLFAQIQCLLALERLLALPLPLPTMRGWAGSPDFLLRVVEETLSRKPSIIVECSSGVSTLACARALQINGIGHVYSLEHSPEYAAKTRALLKRHDLLEWATVIDAPLVSDGGATPWYSLANLPPNLPPIDMVVVDGPPTATGVLARYPALPSLEKRMAPNVLVVVDDADRDDEQSMLARWRQEYPAFTQSDAYCKKGCILVERRDICA